MWKERKLKFPCRKKEERVKIEIRALPSERERGIKNRAMHTCFWLTMLQPPTPISIQKAARVEFSVFNVEPPSLESRSCG